MIVTRDTRVQLPQERLADWYAKAAFAGLLYGNTTFRFTEPPRPAPSLPTGRGGSN